MQSYSIGKIAEAMSKAQGEMMYADADRRNEYFNASYATLNSVIMAVKTPLANAGIAFFQTTELSNDNTVICTTTLAHKSGEWIKSMLGMKPAKNDPQGIGSALSYIRRYSLAAITGIAQADDDAESATVRPSARLEMEKANAEPLSPAQVTAFKNLISKSDSEETDVLEFVGVTTIEELNVGKFNTACDTMRRKIKENNIYPQKKFDELFPTWMKLIATGQKTADDVIATCSTKGQLTTAMQNKLKMIKLDAEPADNPNQASKGAAE
jgi:hypothetical protein